MADLSLPDDYEDLLVALDAAGAEFVLVGGWAVALHGHGRATDDMDILVRPSPDNALRVFAALQAFGAPIDAHGVNADLFARPRYGYRIGRKPVQIELLTTIDGVSFDQGREGALEVVIAGVPVPVIGREALLANKRAAGRLKDLADVQALTGGDDPAG